MNIVFLEDGAYVELKEIRVSEAKLFIDGIAYICGVNVEKYRDIQYKLLLEGSRQYSLDLAKVYDPSITKRHSKDENVSYDMCWFTTRKHEGILLEDLQEDVYSLYILIQAGGLEKRIRLKADFSVMVDRECFHVKDNTQDSVKIIESIVIDKNLYKQKRISSLVSHSIRKRRLEGSFTDDKGNRVVAPENLENCYLKILGKDNIVEIDSKSNLKDLYIQIIGDNNNLNIGTNASFSGAIRLGHSSTVAIGNDVSSTNPIYLTCSESTKVTIGNDCMFATENQIRSDDAHPIYDVNTGNRLNLSRNISVGDHVWIGFGVTILGGANIGSGSVIGAFSLVNKKFPNNCVLAGTPAKVVKTDIFWERQPLLLRSKGPINFSKDELLTKNYCRKTIL